MTTEEQIKQLVSANECLETLRRAQHELIQSERDLIAATRDADQAIKAEEAATANLGYRRKAFTEARDAQARMERSPGVSFMGLTSPSRLKLETMRQSVLNYARASDLAFQRQDMTRKAGRYARNRLTQLEQHRLKILRRVSNFMDGPEISKSIEQAEQELRYRKGQLSEAEIDEAVMYNRCDTRLAATARSLLRRNRTVEFER